MRELLIGCGHRRDKDIKTPNGADWSNLTTLDYYQDAGADVLFDLCTLNARNRGRLPFGDSEFDELHAYDVLEHTNVQGDYESFFHEFGEYWRVLKPGGLLCATMPREGTIHAWGDPGHRRVINALTLAFLSKKAYREQLGKTTMTDYLRYLGPTDFELMHEQEGQDRWAFVLRAIKR